MNNKYSIVWQEFGPDSDFASRFWVSGKEGGLPFYVDGDKLVQLESGKRFEMNEGMLLKGIMVGYSDNGLYVNTDENKVLLKSLLPILADGFQNMSIEQMILDLSFNLKDHSSVYAAFKCLKNGLLIEPDSSMIRSDLITMVYEIWKVETEYGYDFMDDAIENFYELNLDGILPGAIEIVVYTTFVSVYFKTPDKVSEFLEKYCYEHIVHRVLKDKIKYLLDNKDSELKDALY
ncbi:MAG: hypothetical protein ACOYN6_00230 [Ignavibacteria bacterium]